MNSYPRTYSFQTYYLLGLKLLVEQNKWAWNELTCLSDEICRNFKFLAAKDA